MVKCKDLGTRAGLITYLCVGMAAPTCLRILSARLCPKLTPHLPAPLSVMRRAAWASERRSGVTTAPHAQRRGRLCAPARGTCCSVPGLARFLTVSLCLWSTSFSPLIIGVEWPRCRHTGMKQEARPAAVLSCVHSPLALGGCGLPAPSPQPRWGCLWTSRQFVLPV